MTGISVEEAREGETMYSESLSGPIADSGL